MHKLFQKNINSTNFKSKYLNLKTYILFNNCILMIFVIYDKINNKVFSW